MRSVALGVMMLAVAGGSAAAQEPARALTLTLEEAQARATAASHRLAEAQARVASADALVRLRQTAKGPTVVASGGYSRTNHVTEFAVPGPGGVPRILYPDVPDNYRSRLDLQWPIYSGGRTDALERAARAEAQAAAVDVEVARADLRLEVARAFWALVSARAASGVLDQGVARARANVTDVRERFNAGLIPPNEIASAEAQEARSRMLLIEARNQQAASEAELRRLVGVDTGSIEPAATLALSTPPAPPVDTLVDEARRSRDERRALNLRIDAADEQQVAAASARRPTIGLVSGVDYARPNPRIFPREDRWRHSWDVGVNVAWMLWDSGRVDAEVAAAAATASAARQRLADVDTIIALEVRQRLLDLDSGRAAVSAAGEGVRAATEAHRVVTERYRAGVATQIDVLDAAFALLQAELDLTRTQSGVRLAEARLARAVGR